jgi:hypothetical protein
MTLWQRIKSWFGFKPKQKPVSPTVDKGFTETRSSVSRQSSAVNNRPVPNRSAGESELSSQAYRALANSTPPRADVRVDLMRSTPVRTYGESEVNSDYYRHSRNDNSLLDTILTTVAVDAVLDVVQDAVMSKPEPAYTPPSTNFDDNRSSSWGNDSSSNWGDSVSDAVSSVFSD